MRYTSELEFRTFWVSKIASEFGLIESDIAKIYLQEETNKSGSMEMWKYRITSGVTALPSARING